MHRMRSAPPICAGSDCSTIPLNVISMVMPFCISENLICSPLELSTATVALSQILNGSPATCSPQIARVSVLCHKRGAWYNMPCGASLRHGLNP